jgi:xylitol oxidase
VALGTAPNRGVALKNWAGNITFEAREHLHPTSVEELQALVGSATALRALGAAHSFNPIADSPGVQVSLASMPAAVAVDAGASTATVGAGVRYGELAVALHAAGFALPAMASLPHITVAGACATGTHGSGDGLGNLATAVRSLRLVRPDGSLDTVARGDSEFDASIVGLGSLGIVVDLTLDVVPSFDVRQYVFDDLPFAAFASSCDEIFASAYSVSLFTDWRGPRFNQVWRKQLASAPDPGDSWLGARAADGPRHPVPGVDPIACTQQGGVPGPWHERLPHFKLSFTPSNGEELQSEYLLPRPCAAPALAALAEIGAIISPVLQISELRSIAADSLWMSSAFERDSVAFHFTWIRDMAAVVPVLRAIEARLAPFGARPHWGKVFAGRDLAPLWPRFGDFAALRARVDPAGKLLNPFLAGLGF